MEKKKPEIRFNGFEGEWVTTTLGDIAVRVVSKNEDNSITLPLTISAQYGLISQTEFFNSRIAAKDVRGYYVIKKGEFAYNRSTSDFSPFGAVKRLDGYEAGVLSTLYIVFRLSSEQIQSNYLVNYFSTSNWYQHITESAAEGARNHGLLNITAEDFFKTPIKAPIRTEEQEKIASFLTTLDKLIAKLEAKLDKLRKLKQALLEKMFVNVNGGYKTPEIRFKGYTDKWQVKELREVFEMPTNRISGSELQADRYISTEHILQNFEGVEPTTSMPANLSAIRFFQNDILMANIRPYLKKIWLSDRNGGASSDVIVFHITIKSDPAFLYYELTNGRFIEYVMESIQGSKMPRGNKQAMQAFKMAIAPLSEQEQIGKCFTQIDTHFSKTSTKLTKLRNIKQSLLQKMFA